MFDVFPRGMIMSRNARKIIAVVVALVMTYLASIVVMSATVWDDTQDSIDNTIEAFQGESVLEARQADDRSNLNRVIAVSVTMLVECLIVGFLVILVYKEWLIIKQIRNHIDVL
jgi:predicted PurR-regulated permease PerM